MAETRRIQLHLGKCIEDLDKLYNVPDLNSKRATVLCKSAQKLFEKAEESRDKGDEEYSYVYYMKYLRVVAFLSKEKEYQKDKLYFNNMLGAKNPNKALDAAEKLKKSLIDRYEMSRKVKHIEEKGIDNKKKEKLPQSEPTPTSGLPAMDEVTISSEQLYPLLKSRKLQIMILDARPGKDFLESHINYSNCISVPEECLSPGQSANVLEQKLPLTSRSVWAERANMDLIVLLDWSSTNLIPGKHLFLLKTILLKWDVKVHYARPPLALWGGYEDWMLKYPASTTNPQAVPPSQVDLMQDMLGEIDYPNWAELSPPPPPPQPPAHTGARAFKPGEPVIDRSSKAAAVQVYEERARSMQLILDRQERIADTSLTLEMQRIEAEQDWERVRGQQEVAQRDEMRAMYKMREQEIISQLMQLENKQYDMEQENQNLRDKLEEYQRRERDEAEKLAESLAVSVKTDDEERKARSEQAAAARDMAAKRARIAAVTEQKDQLDRQRELMETQRKRKLAEARDKKKPDLDKDEDGDTYMVSPDDDAPGTLDQASAIETKEEQDEERPAPRFDRSTKPYVADAAINPRKEVEPAWAEVASTVERGLTGLFNIGNSCYMNSILQCLNNTAILITYFSNGTYHSHINRSHITRGTIAEEVGLIFRSLWSGEYRHISPKNLRVALGKHQRAFRDSLQQDSHEFLTILMDFLHLDLQFNVKPPTKKENLTPSDKAWLDYTKSKESLILRAFYGQIKSTVTCTVCREQSVTFEPFSNLSLELPMGSNRCTLTDCLKLYLNGEIIPGWNCPSCKEKRDAVKKLDISRLPPVLVIHFKRFYLNLVDDEYAKKLTYIDFPLTDLNMKPFALNCPSGQMYDLYAVSNHYGNVHSGHYTAACKNSLLSKWYIFDDHAVTEIAAEDVKSSAAYIVFYTACRTV